jgi:hypothetical protein
MPLTLRLDPWTPTYESALQIEEDETGPQPDVDPFVETDDWRAREPQFVERPRTIAFVDGVQRVEMRVIGDRDGKVVYGAFASVAVGAVFAREGGSDVAAETPLRILALADGETHPAVSVPCGEATLEFRSRPTAASGLAGVQEAVQSARREAEIALGERLDEQGHEMVVVDGRLNRQPKRKARGIGLIKTRTPLFRIGRDRAVYSWYLRLTEGRAIDHAWAGVVRVETLETIGIEAAVKLADLTACHLPTFASDSAHDPRAPQNLYPIGGLEDQLRHSLGDPEWIRRHIEMHFAREIAAA